MTTLNDHRFGMRNEPVLKRLQDIAYSRPQAEHRADSIRRECLDHIIVFGEAQLRPILEQIPIDTTHTRRT
jgi:hypothetical protein